MPQLAYGMGTRWSKSSENELDQELVDATTVAIDLGYRLLDGAQCTDLPLGSHRDSC
jgi:diketogulonate reductase-like aldo/keto reductase